MKVIAMVLEPGGGALGRIGSWGRQQMTADNRGAYGAHSAAFRAQEATAGSAPRLAGTEAGGGWPGLSELMARMSHDIRTPLNSVIGFADLMHRETFGSLGHQRYREYVDHIRECGDRLLRITEATLTVTELAARTTPAAEEFELDAVIESAVSAASAAFPFGHCIVRYPETTGFVVRASRSGLLAALRSLTAAAMTRAAPDAQVIFSTTVECDRIRLEIMLAGPPEGGEALRRSTPSLDQHAASDLAMARTLLSLQDLRLIERTAIEGAWSVAIDIENSTGPDLFSDQAGRG